MLNPIDFLEKRGGCRPHLEKTHKFYGVDFSCNGVSLLLQNTDNFICKEEDNKIGWELTSLELVLKLMSFDIKDAVDIEAVKQDCTHCAISKKCKGSKKCKECDGEGIVRFGNDFNEYECDCESCHGRGGKECGYCHGEKYFYIVSGIKIQAKFFRLIENCKIIADKKEDTLYFFAGENERGLIMGIRQ